MIMIFYQVTPFQSSFSIEFFFLDLVFIAWNGNYLKSNLIRKRGLQMWDKTTNFWWILKGMTSAWEEAVLHCDISTALSVRFRLCGLNRSSITNSCKRKSPLDASFACSKSGELVIEWRVCLFNSELSFHESLINKLVTFSEIKPYIRAQF